LRYSLALPSLWMHLIACDATEDIESFGIILLNYPGPPSKHLRPVMGPFDSHTRAAIVGSAGLLEAENFGFYVDGALSP
jgi:hypothetical protein